MERYYRATDLISKNNYLMLSRFRQGTVVAIPKMDNETYKDYRDRCRLNPHCIGVAVTDALPSQIVVVDLIPPHYIKNHETSKD